MRYFSETTQTAGTWQVSVHAGKSQNIQGNALVKPFQVLQDVLNLDMYDELNHKVPLSDEQADTIIRYLTQKTKQHLMLSESAQDSMQI